MSYIEYRNFLVSFLKHLESLPNNVSMNGSMIEFYRSIGAITRWNIRLDTHNS